MTRPGAMVLLLMTLACAPEPNVERPATSTGTTMPRTDAPQLELDVPAKATAGRPVPLRLTVRNSAKAPVQVTLGGRPPADFIVTGSDGREVWRWSTGKAVQAILEIRTLQPGEALDYRAEWVARTGRYRVRGLLNLDPPETIESAEKDIRVSN